VAFTPGSGTGTRFSTSASSFTRSHTVASATGRILYVVFVCPGGDNPGATTATWDGTTMGSPIYAPATGGVRIWRLVGAANGTFDVVITTTNAVPSAYLAVMSWTADGAITVGTLQTDVTATQTPSLTVSSATGNLVVGGFGADYGNGLNPAPGSGVTERFSSGAGSFNAHFADKVGAASVTFNYDLADFSSSQVLFADNLVEASGPPADNTTKPGTLGQWDPELRALAWFG
jgi:hypothetical protein